MPKDLLSVHGVCGLIVAAGADGRILHFGGDVYQAHEPGSPTVQTLRGVFVESPTRAWAVGDGGTVLRWDGTAWRSVALAAKHEGLRAIWGCPEDGVWIGGQRSLFNYGRSAGGILITTDFAIRAIWSSGTDDVWYLTSGRSLMVWCGPDVGCISLDLPGDPDEEWNAIAGNDQAVFVVGISGLALMWDRERGRWYEFASDTTDLLTGAVCAGPDLYVTTDRGQVRRFDGRAWSTVAFSAFGPLHSICLVDGVLWAAGARGVVLQHQPETGEGNE